MTSEDATDRWNSERSGLVRRDAIRDRAVFVSLIVAAAVLFGLLVAGGLWIKQFSLGDLIIPKEETRVSRYAALIKGWQSSGLVSHFPVAGSR